MPRRVILLGASNLTRGFSTVIETARLLLGSPLHIFAAHGHGRSYGMRSRFLMRQLPGILECGLWPALRRRPPAAQTYALITDPGNDIVYGRDPETLIEWIDECITRLNGRHAKTIITQVPIARVRRLPEWRYSLLRAILYPSCRLPFAAALDRAERLSHLLGELAMRRHIPLIDMNPAWYGFDAIHIQRKQLSLAWSSILSHWIDAGRAACAAPSLRRCLIFRRATPETYRLFGRELHTSQPAVRLPNGTIMHLY